MYCSLELRHAWHGKALNISFAAALTEGFAFIAFCLDRGGQCGNAFHLSLQIDWVVVLDSQAHYASSLYYQY